jgi:hypothetical protein
MPQAQSTLERSALQANGESEANAAIYEVRQVKDRPELVETIWGEISVMPGDYVFTDPQGNKFGVPAGDYENSNIWFQR